MNILLGVCGPGKYMKPGTKEEDLVTKLAEESLFKACTRVG